MMSSESIKDTADIDLDKHMKILDDAFTVYAEIEYESGKLIKNGAMLYLKWLGESDDSHVMEALDKLAFAFAGNGATEQLQRFRDFRDFVLESEAIASEAMKRISLFGDEA